MKILVVSLLRLGDLIQQRPLLGSLREKYPQCEIHLLINRQFSSAQELFREEKIHFHYFDRELLQRSMGESSFNLFSPLALLDELIAELNAENFDLAMNWTHNKLSAFLLGTLNIPEKQGLNIQEAKLHGLESPWLRYFNDNFSENAHSYFHYVELLGKAFDLPVKRYQAQHNFSSQILFQCLTSDVKKNWPVENFVKLKVLFAEKFPDLQVKVLATPNEKQTLSSFFTEEEILVCSLSDAQNLLKQSRLLISADTSIKHLAAECGTPLVEIALGGSNAHKTAAFSLGNRVIAGKSPCYPCRHSQKCPQKSHLCAESVSAEEVFAAACELLQSQGVTDKNETGKNEKENEKFERAVWTAYLDRTDVTYSLCPLIAKDLLKKTELLQQYQQSFESCENFNEIYTTLQVIAESKIDSGFYFQKLTQVFSDRFSSAESAFSALKRALEQSRDLLQMRIQIIHQTLSMEGETHAERT